MIIGFVISIILLGLFVWLLFAPNPRIPKPPKEQKFDNTPNSKGDTKMDDNNEITELIRQQEQTNKHLQKLISDFFWFRIGIICLLIFGGISVTGGFN